MQVDEPIADDVPAGQTEQVDPDDRNVPATQEVSPGAAAGACGGAGVDVIVGVAMGPTIRMR